MMLTPWALRSSGSCFEFSNVKPILRQSLIVRIEYWNHAISLLELHLTVYIKRWSYAPFNAEARKSWAYMAIVGLGMTIVASRGSSNNYARAMAIEFCRNTSCKPMST